MSVFQKLMFILSSAQKRGLLILGGLLVIGIFIEMIGLGILIPALSIVLKSDIAKEYPSLQPFLAFIGNPSEKQLVTLCMSFLIFIYFFKCLYLIFITWKQTKFNTSLTIEIANKLFLGYLTQPYDFHLQRNSAGLVRNIQSEVGMLNSVGQSVLILATEFSIVFSMIIILFIIEPLGALSIAGFLGVSGYIFHRLTKFRISIWGEKRQKYDMQAYLHVLQGLGGIKDIKLLGKEKSIYSLYKNNNDNRIGIVVKQTTLTQVPRIYLELLAVFGLASLVILMTLQARPLEQLIPILGVFVAAAFRMIPSVNRIMGAVQNIQYGKPVVELLYEEFSYIHTRSHSTDQRTKIDFKNSLQIQDLVFQYENSNSAALKGVSASVKKGEVIGFIGTSGSGKSTLVDVVLGLLIPTKGAVLVDGRDIHEDLRAWQDILGYVPQTIYLTDDSIRRNVAFGISDEHIDEAAVIWAIKSARLEDFVSSLDEGLNTNVGERGVKLSGGQRQRIGIARALYHDPSVLVFDEATSSLDTHTEELIMNTIMDLKGTKTILIVAHRLSTLKKCNRIYRITKGVIEKQGTPENIL